MAKGKGGRGGGERNSERNNGKGWKQNPKTFDAGKRRIVKGNPRGR